MISPYRTFNIPLEVKIGESQENNAENTVVSAMKILLLK